MSRTATRSSLSSRGRVAVKRSWMIVLSRTTSRRMKPTLSFRSSPRREAPAEELDPRRDSRERVPELVGHARREPPERGQPVELADPLLHAPKARHVHQGRHGPTDAPLGVAERGGGDLGRDRGAIGPDDVILDADHLGALFQAPDERVVPRALGQDARDGLFESFLPGEPDDLLGRAVPGEDVPPHVESHDAERKVLDDLLAESGLEVERFLEPEVDHDRSERGDDSVERGAMLANLLSFETEESRRCDRTRTGRRRDVPPPSPRAARVRARSVRPGERAPGQAGISPAKRFAASSPRMGDGNQGPPLRDPVGPTQRGAAPFPSAIHRSQSGWSHCTWTRSARTSTIEGSPGR